jgi:hypothetical protein
MFNTDAFFSTLFDLWLVESTDAEPMDIEGQYTYLQGYMKC